MDGMIDAIRGVAAVSEEICELIDETHTDAGMSYWESRLRP